MSEKKREIRTLADYQRLIERFENVADGFILPDMLLILRIDAHRLGPTWSDFPDSDYPFGVNFAKALQATAQQLFACGLKLVFAFIHGDEISVLLDASESTNHRKRGKLISLISSAGAVGFLQAFGKPVVFEAKLSELPSREHVIDYFMWQRKVAMRNFFSRTMGLGLAAQGLEPKEIEGRLSKLTEEERLELIATLGRPIETVPAYERLGTALWWEESKQSASSFALVECGNLPESDEQYLALLDIRTAGPGYLPGETLDAVELRPFEMPRSSRPISILPLQEGRGAHRQFNQQVKEPKTLPPQGNIKFRLRPRPQGNKTVPEKKNEPDKKNADKKNG